MTYRLCVVAILLAGVGPPSARQPVPGFRMERPIAIDAAGPHRLHPDVPLLTGAQPFGRVRPAGPDRFRAHDGAADLRLFDASGGEIPYLLVHAPAREPEWAQASILPVAASKKTSGFEADFGATHVVDAVEMQGMSAPFLKRLVLEGSGDRERWTVLAAEGTLFDLPEERLRKTTLSFVPGPYRYLRVTWDDTNSGRVSPPSSVLARIVAPASAPRRTLTAAVTVEARPSEPGRSRYRLRLPGARLPIVAVVLDVGAGHVFRQARITESQISGAQAIPVELGRETLIRVEKGGVAAESLRVTIARPDEAELELVVEDGNNPPLKLQRASIELAELPWIYFEAPGGVMTARYGDRSAAAPSYDLEAARDSIQLAELPEARWGEPRESTPPGAGTSALVPDGGAPIDARAFGQSRPIPDGPSGLVALALDAPVLARSRGPAGFADVRIADENGRQVPYLLERRDEPLAVDLTLRAGTLTKTGQDPPHNRSVYAVTLPYPNLPSPRLVLETTDRVFQRSVQVGIERPPDRRRRDAWFDVLASGLWQHADQQSAAPALLLPFARVDATGLLIVVDEGDNRALPITRARVLLPSWRVRFFRPATPLRLLYGHADLGPPRYDLALLAPQVMGAEARELTLTAEESTTASVTAPFVSPRVFWIGLSLAVLILVGLIVRLVAKAD